MIKSLLPICILISALCHSHQVLAQNQGESETNHPAVFHAVANGQPLQFDQGVLQAYTVKEDGSVTILAQTTADILNTTMIVLNITPTDSKKKIKSGEYKILPEDSDSKYLVRAEYAVNENGNSSLWWADASQVKGGWIIIDEITDSRIKGRFSITGVTEKEDGGIDTNNLAKLTDGVFDLPLEIKSLLDPS